MTAQSKEEHRRRARERARRIAARKRLDAKHPEICNCNRLECTGVRCNYLRKLHVA